MSENNTNLSSPYKGDKRGSSRLEWLDAMRGFTMLLVVTYHVAQISFGLNEKYSEVHPLLVLFRMPLFFFVSGFLAYKANLEWTGRLLGTMTWKKLKVQVIPTVVFLAISIVLLHPKVNFFEQWGKTMQSPTKGGYWFTWVLLHMFLIYYLYDFACTKLINKLRNVRALASFLPLREGQGGSLHIWFLWLVMLAFYAVIYMPPVMKQVPDDVKKFLDVSSLIQTMHYTHFFLFGNLVHRYWDKVQRLMDKEGFYILVLITAFVCAGDVLKWHHLKFMWTNLPRTIASYTLLMLVVMFFRHYKEWFTNDHRIGHALQYIGTRTLDIYLLHFLFLPTLPMVGVWFKAHRHNFVLDFSLCVTLAMLVIAFCLLTSQIIRVSPFLRKYLFGR